MSLEITYGFVNEDNILIDTSVILEGDTETLERIKTEYSAVNAYLIPEEHFNSIIVGGSTWNGTRFIPPKPLASSIWSDEYGQWIHPIDYPEDGKVYLWDEETISWKEVLPE